LIGISGVHVEVPIPEAKSNNKSNDKGPKDKSNNKSKGEMRGSLHCGGKVRRLRSR
jgi:hypothetical protein